MFEIPVLERLLHVSNYAVMIGANLLLHSTILIGIGLCVSFALKKKGAAVQSFVLRAFLVAVFLCPVVSVFLGDLGLTGITFDVPVESFSLFETSESLHRLSQKDVHEGLSEKAYSGKDIEQKGTGEGENDLGNGNLHENYPGFPQNEIHSSFMSWRAVLFSVITILWLSITLFYGIRLFVHFLRIVYIRMNADDTELEVFIKSRAIAYQIDSKMPLLLQSPLIESPFITGIFRPAIILPEGMTATREVLIHEFAHLVRRDCLWNMLSYIGRALLPVQPLMRVLSDCIENTSDYACDDYVVKLSRNPRIYAAQLVDFAERFHTQVSGMGLAAGIMSFKSTLRRRVERMLEESGQIFINARAGIIAIILFLCLAAMVVSVFISFKGKRDYAALQVPEKVNIDTIAVKSSALEYKPKFSYPEKIAVTTPFYKAPEREDRTSGESETVISETRPRTQASESPLEKVEIDRHGMTFPDSKHTPVSAGAEKQSPSATVNSQADMDTPPSPESMDTIDTYDTEQKSAASIPEEAERKKPAPIQTSEESGIEEFLLQSRINFAEYKKRTHSTHSTGGTVDAGTNGRKKVENIRKYNAYNSEDSFSWEVILSNKE